MFKQAVSSFTFTIMAVILNLWWVRKTTAQGITLDGKKNWTLKVDDRFDP